MSGSVLDRIGLGLWTMRSLAFSPQHPTAAYRSFADDAVLAERLGFHSIWTAEHRIWYDGWCPAPHHAQGAAIARTSRLRFSNAVALVSQHDPLSLARTLSTLDHLSGGRIELGAGLGHREVEFDALGLRRDRRGARMDHALEVFEAAWAGEYGDRPSLQRPGPPIWIGGMAPRAIARAAAKGLNLMLPQTLFPAELRAAVESLRSTSPGPRLVGTLRDVWIEPDPAAAAAFRERYRVHFLEEAGSWWVLKGTPAFQAPAELARQMDRIMDSALIGSADEVAEGLRALVDAGADFLTLRINFDMVDSSRLADQMQVLAEELPSRLDAPSVPRP